MSRSDLKELGEYLDEGQAGLVVVGVTEMEDDIKQSMSKADKVESREIKADTEVIEQDAKAAGGATPRQTTAQEPGPRARSGHYHTAESIKSCCLTGFGRNGRRLPPANDEAHVQVGFPAESIKSSSSGCLGPTSREVLGEDGRRIQGHPSGVMTAAIEMGDVAKVAASRAVAQ